MHRNYIVAPLLKFAKQLIHFHIANCDAIQLILIRCNTFTFYKGNLRYVFDIFDVNTRACIEY